MLRVQILAKLKSKFSGLSNEFLGFVADKLSVKITEEGQIEGAIDELNNGAISLTDQSAFFQSESDRRVTDAKKKWELENPKPKPPKPDDSQGGEDETKRQLKDLEQKFQVLEKQRQTQSVTEKLHLQLKEKKIPLVFAKGRVVEDEAGLDALVSEIEKDYNELSQDFTNKGLTQMSGTPAGGSVSKESVSKDIEDWASSEKKTTK